MKISEILVHLRLPFSVFLLPIFMFAATLPSASNLRELLLIGIALHLFLYPASNAFNSYYDRDEGPIGGIASPPAVDRSLLITSLAWEIPGLVLLFMAGIEVGLAGLLYGIFSKAYSWDKTRWKRFPIFSLTGIALIQGSLVVWMANSRGINGETWLPFALAAVTAALFLTGVYPITQIYQHKADAGRGDRTFSMLVGIRGTFIHTGVCFLLAGAGFAATFFTGGFPKPVFKLALLVVFLSPALIFFVSWAAKTWHNSKIANFTNTMTMNALASAGLNLFFITTIALRW